MWKGYVSEVYVDRYMAATVDSGGLANDFVGEVPDGYCWYVERATFWSNGGTFTNAVAELFSQRSEKPPGATAQNKQGREDVVVGTDVKNVARDYAAPVFVGPGYFLVVSWSGLTQNDLVAATFQIRVHRLEPMIEPTHHHHGIDESGEMDEHIAHATPLPEPVVTPDQVSAV